MKSNQMKENEESKQEEESTNAFEDMDFNHDGDKV